MIVNHENSNIVECDVVLIGAGIMSATLGVLLKELQPDLKIEIFERLDRVAAESSDAWNNAGTGHSALCELNYTPEGEDGSIDIKKATKILESFEVSKQFWAYLVGDNYFDTPDSFISPVPHVSFVWGEENVNYLKKRYDALQQSHLFCDMEYSENHDKLRQWMPLIMEGRDSSQKLAATHTEHGTDVNFGELTRQIFQHLKGSHDVDVFLSHEVQGLQQDKQKLWNITVENKATGDERTLKAKFVFIGAGGGSLPLLEKSHIREGKGFGGFPVSGQWLICNNQLLIDRHFAKVYGKASVGAPPMSVPHLDTRIINGKKALLFGPYAGFTTKFLKEGSVLDLPLSIRISNIMVMLGAWIHNLGLTKYLIKQVTQSKEDRLSALRDFLPNARMEDWELANAGQRVQVIKHDEEEGGKLEFGTEVVTSADCTIAALLGASPGASTAVSAMLELMGRCFPEQMESSEWQQKLKEMIPSYGKKLNDNPELAKEVRALTYQVLDLEK
jgi:malate dehydrogenase (quinone)